MVMSCSPLTTICAAAPLSSARGRAWSTSVYVPGTWNFSSTIVPAGGGTIVELKFQVPGTYTLVDHALPRALDKGAAAQIVVSGEQDMTIYSGPLSGAGH